MKKYYEVIVNLAEDSEAYLLISEIALTHYCCDGIFDFAMEEEEVDNLLGSDAYSGGETPKGILKYPPIYVTSLNKEEHEKLKLALQY